MHPTSSRMVTTVDHQRLFDLIDRLPDSSSGIEATLVDVLDFAHVIPSRLIEPNVVTMRSQIRLLAGPEHTPLDLTLSYPGDTQAHALSILSPLGASVIGSRVGDEICWQGLDGRVRRAVLSAVPFQPEAAGLFHL